MVRSRGPKSCLIVGMLLYFFYVAGFTLAVFFKDVSAITWPSFVVASFLGGIAAGLMWTAQGAYFAITASAFASVTGQTREQATSKLAGNFATFFLLFEVGAMLSFSALEKLKVDHGIIGAIYSLITLGAVLMMMKIHDFKSVANSGSILAKLFSTASLWSDPVIWLISPTNFTYGFSAAFMNGYVNKHFAKSELGDGIVGFLAAITAATAAFMAYSLGPAAAAFGKGPVMLLGALCFAFVPLSFFVLDCCKGWHWNLLILYFVQGPARAVYESTNRAVFSDFFPGAKSDAAFANCLLQSSIAFAIMFFLQTVSGVLKDTGLAAIVLSSAAAIPVGFGLATLLPKQRALLAGELEQSPLAS